MRSATEDDNAAMLRLEAMSFGEHHHPDSCPPWQVMTADGGSVVVCDDTEIVGMARYLDFEMTVPGGASGPSSRSPSRGGRSTHRRVRTWDFGTSRVKSRT